MRKQASIASAHSERLPTSVMTTSPARTPSAWSRPASRAAADLRERPLPPAAVAAQLDQGKRIRRRRRNDVTGEVHPIYPRTKGSLVAPVSSIQIDFVSVNDLIASMPFSRPMPLQPNPPNGTA